MRDVQSQYIGKKRNFLSKFSNIKAWGNWISLTRLGVLQKLLDYVSETENLAYDNDDDDLVKLVHKDHVHLHLGNLILIPRELRESMMNSDEVSLNLNQSHSYSQRFKDLLWDLKLVKRVAHMTFSGLCSTGEVSPCSDGLSKDYDSEEEDEGDDGFDKVLSEEDFSDDELMNISTEENDDPDFHNISAKLRRLRGELYMKSESGADVHQELFEYQIQVENFTKRFSDNLSKRVHLIWEENVKTTIKDVLENLQKARSNPYTCKKELNTGRRLENESQFNV